MSDQDTITFACETIDRAAALLEKPENATLEDRRSGAAHG